MNEISLKLVIFQSLFWIITIGVVVWFSLNCKLKFHEGMNRWCILYDIIEDIEEDGLDKRNLEVGILVLPEWLNKIF